jgi:hypothetical protein
LGTFGLAVLRKLTQHALTTRREQHQDQIDAHTLLTPNEVAKGTKRVSKITVLEDINWLAAEGGGGNARMRNTTSRLIPSYRLNIPVKVGQQDRAKVRGPSEID